MMVIYEVTAEVDSRLAAEFEAYMTTRHISDVLATGCFLSATMSVSGPRYRFAYMAADQTHLDRYLSDEAARLRDDVVKHFPAGIVFSRETWRVISEFSPA